MRRILRVTGLAFAFVLAFVALAGQSAPVLAAGPAVDGFVQDPVTGVVEPQYVVQGITYTQDQATGDFAGILFTSEDDLGTPGDPSDDVLHFGFSQSVLINDNTYDVNAIGWDFRRKGHSLKDLLQSEHIEVRLKDVNGVVVLDFFIDYASDNAKGGNKIAEPIASTGVGGQDGSMILGDPANILAAASSLEYNFNVYAQPRADWTSRGCDDPLVTNPERIPTNTYGGVTTADGQTPCKWIYDLVYEWSVKKSAFSAGFDITDLSSIEVLEVHNSPLKTGNPVPLPFITVQKTADPVSGSDVLTGQTITYTVSATNPGSVALTDVVVTDVVDINLDNIVPLGGGTYNAGTRTITWPTIALFNPGDTVSVQFTADVIATASLNTEIFNTGTFSSTDIPGGSVDTNTTVHNVIGTPALSLVKTASPATYDAVGQVISYSYDVTNSGNVTISQPITIDDDVAADESCPALPASLATGESITCTASHTITQADLDNGSVTNTASATGQDSNNQPVTSNQDDATVTAVQNPAIDLIKSGSLALGGDGIATPGDIISYTFRVENTGNVTLSNVTVTDPSVAVTGGPIALAPDAVDTTTFTGTYEITQADIDAGVKDNTATATGTPPAGADVADTDSHSEPIVQIDAIQIVKTGALDLGLDLIADPDDFINYTFTVTNTGNTTLSNVALTDTIGGVTIGILSDGGGDGTGVLAPGAVETASGFYGISQADIDAGVKDNTATATGSPPVGADVTGLDSHSETIPAAPAIDLIKSGSLALGVDLTATPGDLITYTFSVQNSGNVTLSNVTVTDPLAGLGTISGGASTLAPGASTTFTATYSVTQADVDAGQIDNTATATGTPPPSVGGTVQDTDPEQVDIPQTATIDLAKALLSNADEDISGTVSLDDTLTYEFVVTNTGNVTLSNVTVTDPLAGLGTISGGASTLAPGASTTFTATYSVTQADVDAGQIDNTATATGTPPPSVGGTVQDTDPEQVDIPQTATIDLAKALLSNADEDISGTISLDDTLTYEFVVTNTGNVTLSNVTVTDPLAGLGTISGGASTLAPGASTTFTATYSVTQADVDAGQIDNTATATGTPPPSVGGTVQDTDPEQVDIPQTATIDLAKALLSNADEDISGTVSLDDTLTYEFVVTNIGNVTLSNVTVTDPLAGLGTISGGASTLAPGASTTFTATYSVTQADVDAGQIDNTATATGTPPPSVGGTVQDTDPEQVDIPQTATIDLAKALLSNADEDISGTVSLDDTLTYEFVVTNTGNVTLSNVTVTDPLAGLGTISGGASTLAPGASTTFTATYSVTQADVDAGQIDNTATATGTPPPSVGGTVQDTDPEQVDIPQTATIDLAKALLSNADEDISGTVSLDDTLTYEFVVTNTGNVTLSNVTVTDPLAGLGTISGGASTLAPGASTTFTATYSVAQADVDAGQIDNTATATGTPPPSVGGTVQDTDPEQVDIPQTATIDLAKALLSNADEDISGTVSLDDTLTYEFVVTNTGNVTLSNVSVTDPLAGLGTINGGASTLAPGASTTFTATYSVTQADVDAGQIDNTATATGTPPPSVGGTVQDTDPEQVDIPQTATIDLAKALLSNADEDGSGDVSLGDTLTYEFVATNTGNVTLSNVSVSDPLPGLSTISPSSVGSLGPNAATTFSATYTVTAADVTAGQVANAAVASGTAPDGSEPSDDDSENVPVVQAILSLSKTSETSPVTLSVSNTAAAIAANSPEVFADAMDTVVVATQITYTITVTNTGDGNAVGVSLTDSVPAGTSFVSAGSSQGSCNEAGGIVTCVIGTLAASGGSATVTLVVQTN